MKAKAYLKQIEYMDAKINTRLEEVEKLNTLATKTTSVMGGERVQASSNQQKMADCVTRIADLKAEINREIDRFVNHKQETLNIMDKHCDPDCINLLYARYFQYKSWETIAHELRYTYKWVSGGLHQRALAQVQKGLDERKVAQNAEIDNIQSCP